MATKKKPSAKPKRTASKKVKAARPAPKQSTSRRAGKKAGISSRSNVRGEKTQRRKKSIRKNASPDTVRINASTSKPRLGDMSGDLQGLRDTETADSESVRELLEEGNALEAGIVAGVEEAEDDPEREVQSREVPEDDVPPEYLDED